MDAQLVGWWNSSAQIHLKGLIKSQLWEFELEAYDEEDPKPLLRLV